MSIYTVWADTKIANLHFPLEYRCYIHAKRPVDALKHGMKKFKKKWSWGSWNMVGFSKGRYDCRFEERRRVSLA